MQNSKAELHQQYKGKLTRVSTTAYRSLARLHHLLITFTPYIPMTAETHAELSQLNDELYRSVDQLKTQNEITETSDFGQRAIKI